MRGDAVGAGLLVAAGLYAAVAAYGFGLGKLSEPGPGFFPFVAAVLVVVCSIAIVFAALIPTLEKRFATEEPAPPVRWIRIWLCVAALAVYAIALPWIGFGLSTFLLMIGLSRIDPTVTWRAALLIGGLGAVGFWIVFAYLLKVNFPPPAFGF
jgi:putative tricarboxylic transport membrane protein